MEPIGPYRSFGMLHCPVCFQRTEFVAFDPDVKDVNDAECCICGHVFGYVRDDRNPEKPHRGAVSKRVADAAMTERMRYERHVLHSTDIDPDLAAAVSIALQAEERRREVHRG